MTAVTLTLVTLPDGHQLDAGAAASYLRMSAARGHLLAITSAYRSTTEQAALYAGWIARRPGYNFALPPGSSVHELGRAGDFGDVEYPWLEAHAGEFGWHRTNANERWHYEYDLTRDRHLADVGPAPLPPAPAAPAPQLDPSPEDTMKDYVIALYVNLLGRMPDATGLSGYLVDIGTGVETLASVELKIRGSDEYQKLDPAVRVQKRTALPIW